MAAEDNSEVSYTVKELLKGIRDEQLRGFADLGGKLDAKADKTDIQAVHGRIDQVEDRVGTVENTLAAVRAISDFWRWAIPAGAGVGAAVAGIVLIFH